MSLMNCHDCFEPIANCTCFEKDRKAVDFFTGKKKIEAVPANRNSAHNPMSDKAMKFKATI